MLIHKTEVIISSRLGGSELYAQLQVLNFLVTGKPSLRGMDLCEVHILKEFITSELKREAFFHAAKTHLLLRGN